MNNLGNVYNYRRRHFGTRPPISVLPKSLVNITKFNIDSSINSDRIKNYTNTTDELNHYEAFYEEHANEILREDRYKSIEEIKRFLDTNVELKNIVETLVDSCIVYDKSLNFCKLELDSTVVSYTTYEEDSIMDMYKNIFHMFNFDSELEAWRLLYDMVAGGKVAYELIYRTESRSTIEAQMAETKKAISLNEKKLKTYGNLNAVNLSEAKRQNISKICSTLDADRASLNESSNLIDLYEKYTPFKSDEVSADDSEDTELYDKYNISEIIEEDDKKDKIEIRKVKRHEKQNDDLIPVELIAVKRLNAFGVARVDGRDDKGNNIPMWKTLDTRGQYKYLPEQCIIVANWSNVSSNAEKSERSYVDGLIRNYNLARSLEESKAGFSILAGQFRMSMVVPTGSKIGVKAKEAVSKLVSQYKEKLAINSSNGEITINGQRDYKFGNNIALPSRTGNTTKVEPLVYNGVDFSDTKIVDYFRKGMYRDSTIPLSRFDGEKGIGKLILFSANGIPYDELAYHKRCNRITSEFSKLLKRPLFYNMQLKNKTYGLVDGMYNSMNIVFNSDGYFDLAKENEMQKAKMENYAMYERLQDGQRDNLFSKEFLMVNKCGILSKEEWDLNQKMLKEENGGEEEEVVDVAGSDETRF
jgi:hypothetical protein